MHGLLYSLEYCLETLEHRQNSGLMILVGSDRVWVSEHSLQSNPWQSNHIHVAFNAYHLSARNSAAAVIQCKSKESRRNQKRHRDLVPRTKRGLKRNRSLLHRLTDGTTVDITAVSSTTQKQYWRRCERDSPVAPPLQHQGSVGILHSSVRSDLTLLHNIATHAAAYECSAMVRRSNYTIQLLSSYECYAIARRTTYRI